MGIDLTQATIITAKLFPNQEVPKDFTDALRKYINIDCQELNCSAIYIAEDPRLTNDFRNFMASFPMLNIEKRQVLVYENGQGASFREDYQSSSPKTLW